MLGRKLAVNVLAVATALTLSSCAQDGSEPVVIAADPSDPEQWVLAEIYRQVIELDGRPVGIVGVELATASDKLEMLQSGEANLGVFCSGTLVEGQNPGEEAKLRAQIATANEEDLDVQDATYDAAAGTLPGDFMTLDPSPAQGCEPEDDGGALQNPESTRGVEPRRGDNAKPKDDIPEGQPPEGQPTDAPPTDALPTNAPPAEASEQETLPRNIMPVFKVGLFDRGIRQAMHKATRALSTEDLQKLVERTKAEGDPSRAVNDWMMEKTGMGAELQRIVEEGEARDS
ncbi:hypothetical protein [Corynebacterium sp. CCUG 70398]|uniref:hypothetical protein n=1 Tax=Corynebacterium sp. CCUG 70398 TaxID=2823891 RepID=UPI00210A2FF9|nr:hypothetical protein [Corynebacterium sp. CCUG 70398]MCQ4621865.1 hypothetical protein [Corynebacterium sp. CCUG 70398]